MRFLLDTNICIDLLRGRKDVVNRFSALSPDDCAISSITSFELMSGALKSRNPEAELRKVRLAVDTLLEMPFDHEAAQRSAEVRAKLESEGQKIGAYDTLLAGQALALGLAMATNHVGEFSRVPGLPVENWRS